MIRIVIKYYGEVAEKAQKEKEIINLEESSTQSILEYLKETYGLAEELKVAVNLELVTSNTIIESTDEIAILSQFAGG